MDRNPLNTLKTIEFKNRSGSTSWRVTGMFYGKRVQKNFRTRALAQAYIHGLGAQSDQGEFSQPRVTTTTIDSDERLREAELAWVRLRRANPKASLITAVDFYLENAGMMIRNGQATVVLEDYLEQRLRRGNQQRTVDVCNSVLKHFLKASGTKEIKGFDRESAKAFINLVSRDRSGRPKPVSMRTKRDRYDQLHNFAEYLVAERYLSRNFMPEIDRPRVTHDGVVCILSVDQVVRLLQVAATYPVGRGKRKAIKGAMLPYLAICALSGVRPDEAKRLGPDWKWFSKENKLITGFRAKNSASPRTVEIHDELVEILVYCQESGFAPSAFTVKAFNHIREQSDVRELWGNDILRHSFASHHYAANRDIDWLEKNMGNSSDVLRRAYLNRLVVPNDGTSYLTIGLDQIYS